MIMLSVTLNNVIFKVSKVHRNIIDSIHDELKPTPPTELVEIWGGVEEEVYVYDNLTYLNELSAYNSSMYTKRRSVFLGAIDFNQDDISAIIDLELYALTNDVLLACLTTEEINKLFDTVLYLSTVSEEGLHKAFSMYAAEWRGTQVHTVKLPSTDIVYSQMYRDMSVAMSLGYKWKDFCLLSGQEQSNIIAFNQIQSTLEHLERRK